jgi:hypothetical protein
MPRFSMMGVMERKWEVGIVGVSFVWQILADFLLCCWDLVGMSYTHHLLLHKVAVIREWRLQLPYSSN